MLQLKGLLYIKIEKATRSGVYLVLLVKFNNVTWAYTRQHFSTSIETLSKLRQVCNECQSEYKIFIYVCFYTIFCASLSDRLHNSIAYK